MHLLVPLLNGHYLYPKVFTPSLSILPISPERGVNKWVGEHLAVGQGNPPHQQVFFFYFFFPHVWKFYNSVIDSIPTVTTLVLVSRSMLEFLDK